MDTSGTLLAIESADESLAKRYAQKLKDKLERGGYHVTLFDFPQYSRPSSYFIREYTSQQYGEHASISPYTASLFYALDRYHAAPALREALERGNIVLTTGFTGMSMAQQGSKFANQQEQRGYFIWLDNLEFEMLGIPRPACHVVLDTKANTPNQQLFTDLCKLFPKDFARLKIEKSAKTPQFKTLWETVQDLLPAKPVAAARPKSATQQVRIFTPQDATPLGTEQVDSAQITSYVLMLGNTSHLVATQLLSQPHLYAHIATSGAKPRFYTPAGLDPTTNERYRTIMQQIAEQYQLLAEKIDNAQVATAVLPAATKCSLALGVTYDQLKNILTYLLASPLPEAKQLGSATLQQLSDHLPQLAQALNHPEQGSAITYQTNIQKTVHQLAQQHLPSAYADTSKKTVDLVQVTPRNEFNLIPYMLYEHSTLGLRDLEEQTAAWPYARKLDAFIAYSGERFSPYDQPGAALDHAIYTWDITTEYNILSEQLQTCPIGQVRWQQLTPRYGYDMPAVVDDSELTEQFETCFDRSLELHSLLQGANRELEAQYATLMGHKTRWTFTHTARQAFILHEQPYDTLTTGYKTLLHNMREQLTQTHPLLSATLQFASETTD